MIKLSEAIVLNGMTKPQGYGAESFYSIDAPCALGGALQTIGRQPTSMYSKSWSVFKEIWPWSVTDVGCPLCPDWEHGEYGYVSVIWHLNDTHHWTRQQIAEWVATVEPASLSSDENEIVIPSALVGDSPKGDRQEVATTANADTHAAHGADLPTGTVGGSVSNHKEVV